MGSYDYAAHDVVNLRLLGCRMERINDETLWGVINSNFCKGILLEDCVLSRMDTHQGVSGGYAIRRCTLGHMGINAVGRGALTVEDSTLHGPRLVSFRLDYGSTIRHSGLGLPYSSCQYLSVRLASPVCSAAPRRVR